jgi:TPR repeat protein
LCPFCRSPSPQNGEEILKLRIKHLKANDPNACFSLGTSYLRRNEELGVPQDLEKGMQLLLRGGKRRAWLS